MASRHESLGGEAEWDRGILESVVQPFQPDVRLERLNYTRATASGGLLRMRSALTIALATAAMGHLVIGSRSARAQLPASAPVPATQAASRMTLPEGFTVTLFAGEPDVVQPIAMTIDPRGRLWVVENYSYPIWLGGPRGKDRILIFEDTDGDGRFDRRTVFFDKGTNFTGHRARLRRRLGLRHAQPALHPRPRRRRPARRARRSVSSTAGTSKAQHNVFNGLKWGPDGWLYGCNGILSISRVGKPGTPDEERVPINCGVWRYHPTRAGLRGRRARHDQPLGPRLRRLRRDVHHQLRDRPPVPRRPRRPLPAHVRPGPQPNRYGLDGDLRRPHPLGRRALAGLARGPGATTARPAAATPTSGAMIYLGDNWPDRYRNSVFTCNIHGHRVNHDRLERRGSSYVARHEPDFLLANDPWFRGLELKYGPDGGVYLTDWSDTGECHENDADNAHRENGRIYKISYGTPKPVKVDLAGLERRGARRLQLHKNEWYVRTARRLLQERAPQGRDLAAAQQVLRDRSSRPIPTRRTSCALSGRCTRPAVWMRKPVRRCSLIPSEHVRAWAIRLLCDAALPSALTLARFAELAGTDPSPKVRLSLASALQRLPVDRRWAIAEPLAESRRGCLGPGDSPHALVWSRADGPCRPRGCRRASGPGPAAARVSVRGSAHGLGGAGRRPGRRGRRASDG